ncbi:hypothetical protein ACFUTV_41480 [Streptomyces sp. NPDC057298]|uniref:hypothetical protein n=1 Tax=Streptomyces sp. NPDC057298 TaxID=3346091 RepID=UPI003637E441
MTLRRSLVDRHHLRRSDGVYRRVDGVARADRRPGVRVTCGAGRALLPDCPREQA